MRSSKLIVASSLLLSAALLIFPTHATAQQPATPQPATAHQLPQADEKAIQTLLKDQETAWNKHDMKAFTKPLRDDAEGINVAGMYWRGKAAIVEHLVEYHNTFLKDCQEYLQEMQIHPLGDGYAVAVSIWKVDGFTGPGGVVIPPCRHRDTSVLARDADGWKVVHFHNTTVNEEALKNAGARKQ